MRRFSQHLHLARHSSAASWSLLSSGSRSPPGWIDSESSTTTTVAAPLSAPVDAKESGGRRQQRRQPDLPRDGQGVAFIESDRGSRRIQDSVRSENPKGAAGRHRDRLRLPDRHRRPHRHQQPRGRRRDPGRGQARLLGHQPTRPKSSAPTRHRRRPAQGRRAGRPAAPALARRLLQGPGRRPVVAIGNPFGLDRTVTGRHRLRAAAPDPGAQRLLDLARDPDRRRDQPRQLRRPADRQLGPA